MEGFHIFFSAVGDVDFIRLSQDAAGETLLTEDGYSFSRLKLEPIFTPHSCRSTFITRRSGFIELGDIARLVGHTSPIVTAHYQYPEEDELGAKLMFADDMINKHIQPAAPINSGLAMIKAKESNSALVQAFRVDRQATIRDFGLIALKPGLEASDDGKRRSAALLS